MSHTYTFTFNIDRALLENNTSFTLNVNLNREGTSSNPACNIESAAMSSAQELNPFSSVQGPPLETPIIHVCCGEDDVNPDSIGNAGGEVIKAESNSQNDLDDKLGNIKSTTAIQSDRSVYNESNDRNSRSPIILYYTEDEDSDSDAYRQVAVLEVGAIKDRDTAAECADGGLNANPLSQIAGKSTGEHTSMVGTVKEHNRVCKNGLNNDEHFDDETGEFNSLSIVSSYSPDVPNTLDIIDFNQQATGFR